MSYVENGQYYDQVPAGVATLSRFQAQWQRGDWSFQSENFKLLRAAATVLLGTLTKHAEDIAAKGQPKPTLPAMAAEYRKRGLEYPSILLGTHGRAGFDWMPATGDYTGQTITIGAANFVKEIFVGPDWLSVVLGLPLDQWDGQDLVAVEDALVMNHFGTPGWFAYQDKVTGNDTDGYVWTGLGYVAHYPDYSSETFANPRSTTAGAAWITSPHVADLLMSSNQATIDAELAASSASLARVVQTFTTTPISTQTGGYQKPVLTGGQKPPPLSDTDSAKQSHVGAALCVGGSVLLVGGGLTAAYLLDRKRRRAKK